MRIARTPEEFETHFLNAQRESINGASDDTMYLERYVEKPRHSIESDSGRRTRACGSSLGERDCSIQRRHQKLVEECPCAVLSEELRKEMGEAAVKAARAAGYVNAGTIEFLLDRQNRYYFIENEHKNPGGTRCDQEMVTGLDLIKEQIRIAARRRSCPLPPG